MGSVLGPLVFGNSLFELDFRVQAADVMTSTAPSSDCHRYLRQPLITTMAERRSLQLQVEGGAPHGIADDGDVVELVDSIWAWDYGRD